MTLTSSAGPGVPADVVVVGGGLVGSAVAYGLAREGARVTVLDEDDGGFRASRGNFGLVWIQGKGYGLSPYARWSRSSAQRWPLLAQSLADEARVDVALRQPTGVFDGRQRSAFVKTDTLSVRCDSQLLPECIQVNLHRIVFPFGVQIAKHCGPRHAIPNLQSFG